MARVKWRRKGARICCKHTLWKGKKLSSECGPRPLAAMETEHREFVGAIQELYDAEALARLTRAQQTQLLITLRQRARTIYHAVRDGKRAILTAKSAYDEAFLEREAVRAERRFYEGEIEKCQSIEYAYRRVFPDVDELEVEGRLRQELQERRLLIERKQEVCLRKEALAKALGAKKRQLEELKRLLAHMLDGAKQLSSLVEQQVARPSSVLRDFYAKVRDVIGAEYEVKHFAAATAEPASGERRRDLRHVEAEHVAIQVLDLTIGFTLTEQSMIGMSLWADQFSSQPSQSDAWYLQLPLDGSLLLTIPGQGALALRWVNAIGSVLPDPSFSDDDLLRVVHHISNCYAYRKRLLDRLLVDYKIDEANPNRVLVDGTVVVLKGTSFEVITDDDSARQYVAGLFGE